VPQVMINGERDVNLHSINGPWDRYRDMLKWFRYDADNIWGDINL